MQTTLKWINTRRMPRQAPKSAYAAPRLQPPGPTTGLANYQLGPTRLLGDTHTQSTLRVFRTAYIPDLILELMYDRFSPQTGGPTAQPSPTRTPILQRAVGPGPLHRAPYVSFDIFDV